MNCPQCQEGEVDFSGICMNCGYQVPLKLEESEIPSALDIAYNAVEMPESINDGFVIEQASDHADNSDLMETIDAATADNQTVPVSTTEAEVSEAEPVIPQWRRDLAEKLQAVRQKKDKDAKEKEKEVAMAGVPKDSAAAIRAELLEKSKMHTPPPRPPVAAMQQKTLQPLPESRNTSVHSKKSKKSRNVEKNRNVENIIDSAVTPANSSGAEIFNWTSTPSDAHDFSDQTMRVATSTKLEEMLAAEDEISDSEGRLILLSRTLSGLVDLVLIFLFSTLFLIAADYFADTPILSSMSLVNFVGLSLMIHFFYSLFFLGTNSQTIGMMTTGLRVTGVKGSHVSMGQVFRRSVIFLISLFGLGIGLLMGVFNRDCRCLHDMLSGTCIIRI